MKEHTISGIPEPKHRLAFRPDGSFRIVMLSDVQEYYPYDGRIADFMNAVFERERPDLVVFGGDNCSGPHIHTEEEFDGFLNCLTGPAERHAIPWTHVFGNHDHDLFMDDLEIQRRYEAYPYCVSSHTEGLHGVTNFVLPILSQNGGKVVFNVWGLDTNNRAEDMDGLLPAGKSVKSLTGLGSGDSVTGHWDTVRFDQLMWYWNTSLAIEKAAGCKIPGLLCMHIAPEEFRLAAAHPEVSGRSGSWDERLDPALLNSGLFSALLQRGDIRCISCGHTHRNDGEAELCGIRLCFDGSAGTRCYGDEATRGCRIFDLSEKDPGRIMTRMIRKSEYGL